MKAVRIAEDIDLIEFDLPPDRSPSKTWRGWPAMDYRVKWTIE